MAAYRRSLVSAQSARLLCGYIYASAGEGESTPDVVYGGHNLIAENLIEKGIAGDALIKVFEEAKAERATGVQVKVVQMKKNRKFQVEQLEKEGYTEIRSFYVEK